MHKIIFFFTMILLFVIPSYAIIRGEVLVESERNSTHVDTVNTVGEVYRLTRQPDISILATDYLTFDNGKLQALLTEGSFPVNNAACYINVLYPNETLFIDNFVMNNVNVTNFEGIYTLDFTVPNATGVYPVSARCFYNVSTKYDYPQEINSNMSINPSSDSNPLYRLDGAKIIFDGGGICNSLNCSIRVNFTLPVGYDNSFLNDIRFKIHWDISNNNNDLYIWEFYNVTLGDWQNFLNMTKTLNQDVTIEREIDINDFVNPGDRNIRFRAWVISFNSGTFEGDLFRIERRYNGSIVADLRGNSEIVVSKKLDSATNLILSDEPIISIGDAFGIILLLAIAGLIVSGYFALAGLSIILWVLFFSGEIESLIKGLLLLFGVIMLIKGFLSRKNK